MCINYRALNKISVKNIYPLPWIDELIGNLKGAKFFTKLDLKSRYHQIPIESTDVWEMAFKMKEGLYEWLFMPFSSTNAPATLMRYMDDLLPPFIGKCVIVYLDDILIFSQSWEEHVKQLRKIFDTLQQHQLYMNMEKKCSFMMTSIKYFGYVIASARIHVDRENVHILKDWPIP